MKIVHLNKSPLVEVTFYVQGQSSLEGDKIDVAALHESIGGSYNNFRIVEPRVKTEKSPVIIAESGSEHKAMVLSPSSFSFTVLDHYDDWSAFVGEALSKFFLYEKFFEFAKGFRFGIRSVNKLPLLKDIVRPDGIFVNVSESQIGKTLPLDFLLKETKYHPDYELYSTCIQSVRTTRSSSDIYETRPFLDIDVFAFNRDGITSDCFSPMFERMHELKNMLFFSLLRNDVIDSLK